MIETREDLLKSTVYWMGWHQLELYRYATKYMRQKRYTKKKLAQYLNLSLFKTNELLNGDFNGSLYEFIRISLLLGYYPEISYSAIPI